MSENGILPGGRNSSQWTWSCGSTSLVDVCDPEIWWVSYPHFDGSFETTPTTC